MKPYAQIAASDPMKPPTKTEIKPLTFNDLEGKTVWFVPNPKRTPASTRVGFSKTPMASLDEMVYADSPVKLQVRSVKVDGSSNTLDVVFPDGSTYFMHCDATSLVDSVKLESASTDDITDKGISYFDYKLRPMSSFDASDQEEIFTTDPKLLTEQLERVKKASQEAALKRADETIKEENAINAENRERERQFEAVRNKAISRQPVELQQIIRSHKIRLGMTPEQVTLAWGRPQDINRTTTLGGTREQWVYGLKTYVYFQDGVVTAVQN